MGGPTDIEQNGCDSVILDYNSDLFVTKGQL